MQLKLREIVPEAPKDVIDPAVSDKLRGGYYTPMSVAEWISHWAVRTPRDRVLEPSCGDGVFLEAAARRLLQLGLKRNQVSHQVFGVEIIPKEAEKSAVRLANTLGVDTLDTIFLADFFAWLETRHLEFDVVVGNPPFIRYQNFPEPARNRAMQLMAQVGLRANHLTNIWVPFVVGAVAALAAGGRLGMVLPAELLQVSYAGQLRSFLVSFFEQIKIYACNDLFFDRAEQEVILVLAEGRISAHDASCEIDFIQQPNVAGILSCDPNEPNGRKAKKRINHSTEKWLKYFLTPKEISFMRTLRQNRSITTLGYHASIDVGVVTGRNEFFVLTEKQVEEQGFGPYVVRLVARSAHLRGAVLGQADFLNLSASGQRVYLFYVNGRSKHSLPRQVKDYITQGEERHYHKGYKCSIRDPWYSVPSVWSPDCFLFRQIYDFPRVVLNKAGATSTDTIHRVKCKSPKTQLVSNLYTHLTAASAEIEGRSYGGGVLELEPTEAEHLLVPKNLAPVVPLRDVDCMIRAGKLDDLLQENDKLLLEGQLGLSEADCRILRNIWTKMRDRRMMRKRQRRS
jgi:adenine-specific DNA-methyltransferase